MLVQQFEDKNLAHYSYAILSQGEIALIDPGRNPKPYYDYAKKHEAKIIAVIETHPHADFVSSHKEIYEKTNATIYVSKLLSAEYPHETFDEGDALLIGESTLKALNTPGHSPDSISILALNEKGEQIAVFTGDTLFIGDCGRPDLREEAGAITATRAELAKQMYSSLRKKLMPLNDAVLIYPAHGAGSLCGKGLSAAGSSTIGAEKISNWSLQNVSEEKFVIELLTDQPFIPAYFPYNVGLNKIGAKNYKDSIKAVEKRAAVTCKNCAQTLHAEYAIIDTRPQKIFKQSHLKNAINLMNDTKFETWLGSIIKPEEPFYLIATSEAELDELIARIAKIGYEAQIVQAFTLEYGDASMPEINTEALKQHPELFTILDIRNETEVKSAPIFSSALAIPLHQLRNRINEIPLEKPIVVHCAGGYRSAAGSTILKSKLNGSAEVYDLGEAIKEFQK